MKTVNEILLKNLGTRISEIDESLLSLIEICMYDMAYTALFEAENTLNGIYHCKEKINENRAKLKNK